MYNNQHDEIRTVRIMFPARGTGVHVHARKAMKQSSDGATGQQGFCDTFTALIVVVVLLDASLGTVPSPQQSTGLEI